MNRPLLKDSAAQLEYLGLCVVNAQTFIGDHWRVDRTADPDYPWTITRLADRATRLCCSLIECVQIVREPEKPWGFVKGGAA